ncbi:MAG: C-terminal binding protein [Sphaerochaetaceae bacterium]|jgi:D-3-phosphoglycerate dehydrogenase|nr:C-terminal binding protein [Sphaerochaetaceae bacterium]
MKIVFTDYYYPDNAIEREILMQLPHVEIVDLTQLVPGGIKTAEALIPHVQDADALVVQFADISAKVIDSLKNCKIIVRYAIGVDNIAVDAAKAKGITVSNVPDYCIEDVSDTALAHILNLQRAVSKSDALLRDGSFSLDKVRPLRRIADATVGLVAFGHIARRTAEKLRPFGSRILAFDPFFNAQDSYPWVTFVSLDELLAQSDIVSIHAPLTAKTRHLIGKRELALMKKGAFLVNTSRGGLIDEHALVEALQEKHLGGVGLDVLDMPDTEYKSARLLDLPGDIVVTPHLGWYSEASIVELKRKVAQNIVSKMQSGKALYEV